MRRNSLTLLIFLLLAAFAPVTAMVVADSDTTPQQLENAIYRAFGDGKHDRAAELITDYLDRWPNDSGMLYNLACAHSRLGELEEACSALYRSVQAGFRDFEHMQRDPDLAAIREEQMYKAIVAAIKRVDEEEAEDALARWKRAYGEDDYRFELDEQRRLAFATALDEVAHREMRTMLQREADHLIEELFGAPPSYFVLIAVPTPDHAHVIFGGDDSIGGKYEHNQRRLVARDIGGSLRHEFVHALHYGHMERLGLTTAHPIWIQEGLAALYEDYEIEPDGSFRFLPNERHNIVRQRAKIGRLAKWNDLFEMSADRFMTRAGWAYPQSRSIFEFLADRGRHAEWYRVYVEHFEEDPTGAKAFEVVFDKPLEEIEKEWRNWVRRRPKVDALITHGDASLGILGAINGNNDGVRITRTFPGSAAERSNLRVGDVIVSVDGKDTRSMRELRTIIGGKRVGDRVVLRVRRRGEYLARTAVLRPHRGG